MKRKSRYEFRPYSPRRQDIRDWPGWYLVSLGILFLVAVGLVGVGHSQHGVSCLLAFGYLTILVSLVGLVVLVRHQWKYMEDLEQKFERYRRTRARKKRVFRE
ncbi:MAG: hypothetical protein GWN58_58060 [Anaerolineae bacterium]|nr:hypothetical protein [Anaerolineae bacterium]